MNILKNVPTKDFLFLDIETVRIEDELKPGTPLYDSFEYKMRYSREVEEKFNIDNINELWKDKAALWSEFAKIVCISLGYITPEQTLRIKSYAGDDEKTLLQEFSNDLHKFHAHNPSIKITGHAINGFDIPFIFRRMIVNGIRPHNLLDVSDKKPWEVLSFDTLTMWKGTGFYGASLINIATCLGLPSPKSDINGSEVGDVYWQEKNLDRIVSYCERDVETVANIIRKFRFEETVEREKGVIKIETLPLIQRVYQLNTLSKEDGEALVKFCNEQDFDLKQREDVVTIIKAAVTRGKISSTIEKKLLTVKKKSKKV